MLHAGKDEGLRVIVRRVHGGTRALGGRLTKIEGRFQIALLFLKSGAIEQLIGLEAKPFALIRAGHGRRWVRAGHSGLPAPVLPTFRNLRQLKRVLEALLERIAVVGRERVRVVARIAEVAAVVQRLAGSRITWLGRRAIGTSVWRPAGL